MSKTAAIAVISTECGFANGALNCNVKIGGNQKWQSIENSAEHQAREKR